MPRKTKQNDITSPELLAQVNPKNKELLKDFLDYLRSIKRSETTIAGYENDIQIAWVWCLLYNDNKFYVDWKKRNIVAYQNWLLNENKNSPARIRRLKAALSSMGNYIEAVLDDEFPEYRNIINKVESPALQPVREKTVMTVEEVNDMLTELVEKKKYELACFTALAAFGGRRRAEICRFRVSDFSDDKLVCGGALWKSAPIKTKGRSDGKYLNCYTLAGKFRPYLELWMNERKERGIESEWLFPDHFDQTKQLPLSTVNAWALSISNMIGRDFYYHCLRHNYTTMLSDNGIPDSVIKDIQGWSDISMVSVYIDRNTDDTLDKYFGEEGFKVVEKKSLEDL